MRVGWLSVLLVGFLTLGCVGTVRIGGFGGWYQGYTSDYVQRVSVTVVDRFRQPLEGAETWMVCRRTGTLTRQYSDRLGRVEFTYLIPGDECTIRARYLPEYTLHRYTVQIPTFERGFVIFLSRRPR